MVIVSKLINELGNKYGALTVIEVTKDKNGIESLRFPSFVCIREEGKEVSYN